MRIYLADDDEDDRTFFEEALNEIPLNTEVTSFSDGVELMAELISEQPLPDMIFLDLNMPLMDGFECLQDIRNEVNFQNIPVVIYSTSFYAAEVARLQEMGATRYLKKPSSYNQLKTLLCNCVNGYLDNLESSDSKYDEFVIPD